MESRKSRPVIEKPPYSYFFFIPKQVFTFALSLFKFCWILLFVFIIASANFYLWHNTLPEQILTALPSKSKSVSVESGTNNTPASLERSVKSQSSIEYENVVIKYQISPDGTVQEFKPEMPMVLPKSPPMLVAQPSDHTPYAQMPSDASSRNSSEHLLHSTVPNFPPNREVNKPFEYKKNPSSHAMPDEAYFGRTMSIVPGLEKRMTTFEVEETDEEEEDEDARVAPVKKKEVSHVTLRRASNDDLYEAKTAELDKDKSRHSLLAQNLDSPGSAQRFSTDSFEELMKRAMEASRLPRNGPNQQNFSTSARNVIDFEALAKQDLDDFNATDIGQKKTGRTDDLNSSYSNNSRDLEDSELNHKLTTSSATRDFRTRRNEDKGTGAG